MRRSPASGSWKTTGAERRDVPRLPQVREVDDRELEALAAVDREHLDGVGVGLEPAAALLVGAVLGGLGDPPPQPRAERGRPELLGRRGGVQQLRRRGAGRSARARRRRRASTRAGSRSARRDRLRQRGDARGAQHARPRRAAAGGPPPTPRRSRARDPLRASSRGTASARRACARGPRRAAPAPRAAAASRPRPRSPNTLPAPLMTAGTPAASSASRTSGGGAVRAHEHGDVAGRDRRAALHGAVVGAGLDLRARRRAAGRRRPRGRARCTRARTRSVAKPCGVQLDRRLVAVDDPHAQRRARRPSGAARGSRPRRARAGRRSPRGRAARRRTARRRRRSGPGRCAS